MTVKELIEELQKYPENELVGRAEDEIPEGDYLSIDKVYQTYDGTVVVD